MEDLKFLLNEDLKNLKDLYDLENKDLKNKDLENKDLENKDLENSLKEKSLLFKIKQYEKYYEKSEEIIKIINEEVNNKDFKNLIIMLPKEMIIYKKLIKLLDDLKLFKNENFK